MADVPTPEQAMEAIQAHLGDEGKVYGLPWLDASGEWRAFVALRNCFATMGFRIGPSREVSRG